MFVQLKELQPIAGDAKEMINCYGLRDAIWCAYYGRGFPHGALQMALSLALISDALTEMGFHVLEAEIRQHEGRDGTGTVPESLLAAIDLIANRLAALGPVSSASWDQSLSTLPPLVRGFREMLPDESSLLMNYEVGFYTIGAMVKAAKSSAGVED